MPSRALSPALALLAASLLAAPAGAQTTAGGTVLKALHSGLCLGIAGTADANGTAVVQQACDGSKRQGWTASALSNGQVFVNQATGRCLDVAGASKAAMAQVWQWDCLGANAANQVWDLFDVTGGKRIVSRNSGLCLDVEGASKAAGAKLIQYGCHANANQTFVLAGVSGTATGGTTAGGTSGTGTGTGGTAQPSAAALSLSLRVTASSGWFAKEIFVFTRDANGGIATQQTVVSYNFSTGAAVTNLPVALPAGARWGMGMRVWPNQDKSRQGNPTLYYSDTTGQRVLASSGDCLNGGRTDSWGDSGAPGQHIVYTLTCTQAATGGGSTGGSTGGAGTGGTGSGTGGTGTGTGGTGTGTGTGTEGTGTGTGTGGTGGTGTGGTATPPGDAPPTEATLLVNRRSGACWAAPGGSTAAGQVLQQQTCRDDAADNWRFVAAGGGYQIRNVASGLCAGLVSNDRNLGTRLSQQACSTSPAQLFRLQRLDQWMTIASVASGSCISPTGGNDNRDVGAPLVQWTCDQADPQRWTLSAAEAPGRWTQPIGLPLVPVSAATLPSGKLLMWSADARNAFGTNAGAITYAATYDPATGRTTERTLATVGHDMFCPGISTLADGRLLVAGGSSDTRTTFYDPANDTWTAGPRLNIGRGYNGMTTLSTGEALTVGGSWSGGRGGKTAEVWSPSSGTWRLLSAVSGESIAAAGVEIYRGDNYAWLFPMADGNVFHAGPSSEMHWLRTGGAGEIRSAGPRADDAFANNGNAVMYAPDRILVLGGAVNQTDVPGRDGVFTIDLSKGFGVASTVQRRAPMAFARAFPNTVVLPNGETVTVGGQNVAREFTDERAVLIPELWSPDTATFKRLPPMAVPRNYHSWATLMLDGRVAAGGGGLCGNCTANHQDFEILTPPYLLDAAGQPAARPAILAADTTAGAGGTLAVQTDKAVASFSLVRLSSATHSRNADQRRVPLAARATGGTSYALTLPAQATGQLLPGPWMLFALDAKGVPSVAKIVRIQ